MVEAKQTEAQGEDGVSLPPFVVNKENNRSSQERCLKTG